ncbi:MAG TPA: SDR family NAD(P)-dependent oxidoreductase [Polyangiales bacterium]
MKALVTGASGGIGQAIARVLHGRGAELVLCGRDAQKLSALSAELPGARVLAGDMQDESYVDTLVERAVQALSGLDTLVSCAGLVSYAPVLSVTRPQLRTQLQVNFLAAFTLAQHAATHMRETRQGGVIVNVASTLGVKPAADTAAYAAAKAALISMTRSFALELGPEGVRVNAVAPGVIDTDMVRVVRDASLPPGRSPEGVETQVAAQLEALRQLHPLGRLGTPEDVAQAVLYLLDARFVTGAVLVVDGGLLVRS